MCADANQSFSISLRESCELSVQDLPGAEILYYPYIGLDDDAALFSLLQQETPWQQKDITLFGKTHRQPRMEAWYGDSGANYAYSGIQLQPRPWTPTLSLLRESISTFCNERFNSVLLNYYPDGNHYMGLHADDEPELGKHPVIASLSLGATRRMYFREKRKNELPIHSLDLPSGSLLIMRGTTQENWKHGIRKSKRVTAPRINLTFRRVALSGKAQ
jgi:alkylated DNA repair dioxygenase AlkB